VADGHHSGANGLSSIFKRLVYINKVDFAMSIGQLFDSGIVVCREPFMTKSRMGWGRMHSNYGTSLSCVVIFVRLNKILGA
jgi:hypothetical protein